MILPIFAYGDPILRKVCKEIPKDSKELQQLINDLFETMESASGIGLAAPQVGHAVRLFIINSSRIVEESYPDEAGLKRVFINPVLGDPYKEEVEYNEGCLSLPAIREDITRSGMVQVSYLDRSFKKQSETFSGINARVVLHEYDHINGILFTDYLTPLKKRLLKKELDKISKGDVDVSYPMKFPKKKKRAK